ncbi:MAG: glycosyltransferase family 4 protein, partial [Betaproteobacteria bacterium]|nr:glycosyltransferase family 4 protein [Betaproteobacteria bacterium]
ALKRLEYFLYRKATRIVSVTNSFKAVLSKNGIAAEKIAVIPNGVDLESLVPGPKPQDLVVKHHVQGKFVAAYIGTIGLAHGLGTILDAAERMRDDPRVVFLLVGDGAKRDALEKQARDKGLGNVIFAGAVGKREVARYWQLADAALVLLRDRPVFRHVLPSKMFEAMATARPIVLGVLGESAALLEDAGAGIGVPPEDASALCRAISRLQADPDGAAAMGRRGRNLVEARFDREKLASAMLDELRGVAEP